MKAFLAVALVALAGCTYGAPSATSGVSAAGTMTIDVSLTAHAATAIGAGISGGYAPPMQQVPVGTRIQFVNSDSFAHTASLVAVATSFPASSPLGASALTPSGTALSASWSSGNLAAGTSSPVFVADTPGTYLYGCFYHYGAPMRGAIVVR